MNIFYISLFMFLGLLILLNISNSNAFADEYVDFTRQLAEHHTNQAQIFEQQAKEIVKTGKYQDVADYFVFAAKEYEKAATYYSKLNEYLVTLKNIGNSPLANDEVVIIHSKLNNLTTSYFHDSLTDKFNSHSLEKNKNTLFEDAYMLPPKFQSNLIDNPNKIICKDGLELIFKIDNSPACVSSSSKIKLMERGWIK